MSQEDGEEPEESNILHHPFPPWWAPATRLLWTGRLSLMRWVPFSNDPRFFVFNYRLVRVQDGDVPGWVHDMVISSNRFFCRGVPQVCNWWTYIAAVERLMEPRMLKRLQRVRRMLDIYP